MFLSTNDLDNPTVQYIVDALTKHGYSFGDSVSLVSNKWFETIAGKTMCSVVVSKWGPHYRVHAQFETCGENILNTVYFGFSEYFTDEEIDTKVGKFITEMHRTIDQSKMRRIWMKQNPGCHGIHNSVKHKTSEPFGMGC